jgi:uncharacterized protein
VLEVERKVIMSRIIHFEIGAEKPERAEMFYRNVFNWEFQKWNGPMDYWLIMTGPESEPGINGGMSKKGAGMQNCNTIAVDSIDETIIKIASAGGVIVHPKSAVQGVGWIAYFTDPEGNFMGIMQEDPDAK